MQGDECVSVLVIAYNSSQTILETLNSIAAQTYPYLELIVADDCSTDNTKAIAQAWMRVHSARFLRMEVVAQPRNLGVGKNVNAAYAAARCEWVKSIAADDIMMPSCVEDYVHFVSTHSCDGFVLSNMRLFYEENGAKRYSYDALLRFRLHKLNGMSNREQYIDMLKGRVLASPSIFVKREVLEAIGGYDTTYKNHEDWLTYLHYLEAGYTFAFMDKISISYRIAPSVSHPAREEVFNIAHIQNVFRIQREYCNPRIRWWHFAYYESAGLDWLKYQIIVHFFHNRNNWATLTLSRIVSALKIMDWQRRREEKIAKQGWGFDECSLKS